MFLKNDGCSYWIQTTSYSRIQHPSFLPPWFAKCLTFPFVVVFVVAGCIVYVLAVVLSFIVVFLYCVCTLNMCNVCYLYVLLLYYCHRAKAQLQFNIYIYIYNPSRLVEIYGNVMETFVNISVYKTSYRGRL
jgi:hypothetical protein